MNQLLYNIAGGIVHQIRREERTTILEVIVRGKRNIKQNRNWFYFNFSVESSSFIFNNFKTEKSKVTFKGWHRPVCHLFGFTRVSVKIQLHFTLGQWSESWRRWCRVSFSVVLSLFLPHLRTLTQEKRSENCLRFGTGGPSLRLYPLLSRNIIFWTELTMAAREKKQGEAICSRHHWHQRALSGFWARLRILNLIAWLC